MTPPRRLQLFVAYDGRPFRGWQSQKDGSGIQDHLETAVARLCGGERHPVHGSGRTDTGVHALGQVAHVDVPAARFSFVAQWRFALNAHLPPEIRILRCRWAKPGFHARFDAKGKVYRYRIWNGPVLPPLEIGRAWHVYHPLDRDRLREGAAIVTGRHDFFGFAASRGRAGDPADTIRTVNAVRITGRPGGLLTFTYEGDGFLYKMVRLITGSLIRCATGKEELAGPPPLPAPANRPAKSQYVAPAEGLTLVRVRY